MSKHTPGPWHYMDTPVGFVIYEVDPSHPDARGYVVCEKLMRPDGPAMSRAKADGRLIAAAPDLLAACKWVADKLDDPAMITVLYAAIAKAEGR